MRFFMILVSLFIASGPLFAAALQEGYSTIKHNHLELAFNVDGISLEWRLGSGLPSTAKSKGNPKAISLEWEFHESLDTEIGLQPGSRLAERNPSPCDSIDDTIAETIFSGDFEGLIAVLVVLAIIYG